MDLRCGSLSGRCGRGHLISIRDGSLTGIRSLSPGLAEPAKAALDHARVNIPPLTDLSGDRDVLMGGGSSAARFPLKAPVGVVVEDSRPVFSWKPIAGAVTYTVLITNGQPGALISSPSITAAHWRPPKALARGVTYSWQLRAVMKDGQEVLTPGASGPRAKFKVLGANEEAKLREAARQAPGSHLVLGVVYAGAGLVDQARREFKHLVRENPRSHTAKALLRAVDRAAGGRS
jgi:hypothetical protein